MDNINFSPPTSPLGTVELKRSKKKKNNLTDANTFLTLKSEREGESSKSC
jgi:hypothetical protein